MLNMLAEVDNTYLGTHKVVDFRSIFRKSFSFNIKS